MKRITLAALGSAAIFVAGCGKEASTSAPAKPETVAPGEKPGSPRKLTVKAPGNQSVMQDKTVEFTVSIDRSNFADAAMIVLADLPKGVSAVTKDMTIPAGKDSLTVTLKADPDAPAVDNHVVKVAAKVNGMPDAVSDFKLDVKPKK